MAEEMIKKSAQIVSTVIAATTKCSEHKQASVDHSAHMGHGSGHSLHDGMIMTFHGGYDEVILFDFWQTTGSISMFIVSCLILFVLAALYEGLKLLRDTMLRAETHKRESANLSQNKTISSKLLSKAHIIQSFMHMLQITVSYLLMLVFMTYNSWLCLSVVLGAGLGYFLFGLKRIAAIDVNEHCH